MLGGVHTRLLRRGPGSGVHGRSFVPGAGERLPVDEERDGIFCLGDAVVWLSGGNTGCGAGNDAGGHGLVLHDPAVDVDVVRREVVAADRAVSRWRRSVWEGWLA